MQINATKNRPTPERERERSNECLQWCLDNSGFNAGKFPRNVSSKKGSRKSTLKASYNFKEELYETLSKWIDQAIDRWLPGDK